MTRQWIIIGISIVTVSAIIILIDALLAGLYILVAGSGNFVDTLSNVIFLEGGFIILLGAVVEFFHVAGRDNMIVVPVTLFPGGGKLKESGSPEAVEVKSPGWVLIFIGGLMVLCSLAILLPFGI